MCQTATRDFIPVCEHFFFAARVNFFTSNPYYEVQRK